MGSERETDVHAHTPTISGALGPIAPSSPSLHECHPHQPTVVIQSVHSLAVVVLLIKQRALSLFKFLITITRNKYIFEKSCCPFHSSLPQKLG